MKAAIYARVSTLDQHVENQLQELRRYADARGWTATEFVDQGVSGAKDRRPALDEMLKAAAPETVRCRRVLAAGPTRAEPAAPDTAVG